MRKGIGRKQRKWEGFRSVKEALRRLNTPVEPGQAVQFERSLTITEETTREICSALSSPSCTVAALEFFDRNEISKESILLLTEVLKTNQSLECLSFGRNIVSDGAVEALVEVLRTYNSTLTEFKTLYLVGIDEQMKQDLNFFLDRNSLILPGNIWSTKSYDRVTRDHRFCELVLAFLEIRQMSPETHRNVLLSLFSRQRKNLQNPNSPSVKESFLKINVTSSVIAYSRLAVLFKEVGILKSLFQGHSSHVLDLVLSQKKQSQEDIAESLDLLLNHFDLSTIVLSKSNKKKSPFLSAVRNGLRSNTLHPLTAAKIVSQVLNKHKLLTSETFTKVQMSKILISAISSNFDKTSGVDDGTDFLKAIHWFLDLGVEIQPIEEIHKAVVGCITERKQSPVVVTDLVGLLDSRLLLSGHNTLADFERKNELVMALLNSSFRGKEFYYCLLRLLQKGYGLDIMNKGGKSALDYVLCGPPSIIFSKFGSIKNKKSGKSKMKHVYNQFTGIRKQRILMNFDRRDTMLSIDSARSGSVVAELKKRRSVANSQLEEQDGSAPPEKRLSRTCRDFDLIKATIERTLNLRAKPDFPGSMNDKDASAGEESDSGFDSVGYTDLVMFLLETKVLDRVQTLLSINKNVVEVLFNRVQKHDQNLFESVERLVSEGNFQCNSTYHSPGQYFLGLALDCQNLSSTLLKKFVEWIPKIDSAFDGMTSDGKSLVAHVLKRDVDEDELLEILEILFNLAEFDLSKKNNENEGFLDWLVFNTKTAGLRQDSSFSPRKVAQVLQFVCSKRKDVGNYLNELLVDGSTLLDNIFQSYQSLNSGEVFASTTKRESDFLYAVKIILNSGYNLDTQDINGFSALDFVANKVDRGRFSCVLAMKLLELMLEEADFDVLELEDEAALKFFQAVFKSINKETPEIVRKLVHLNFPLPESAEVVLTVLGADLSRASVEDYSQSLMALSENKVNFKSRESDILEQLFSLRKGDQEQFLRAMQDCCSEDSELQLDLECKDNKGRVFRFRLENDEWVELRDWAKKHLAFDEVYRWEKGAPVHKSATCKVIFATDVYSNAQVALKIMNSQKNFQRECSVRKELKKTDNKKFHQFVLDILAEKSLDRERHYLVLPRADRSLFDVINTERFTGRDLKSIVLVARKAVKALKFLNDNGFSHGDFKPRNLMRTDFARNEWKLIDLDCSVQHRRIRGPKCSTGYAPPEMARAVFMGVRPVEDENEDKPDNINASFPTVISSSSFDIWCFGVVLFELLSGIPLFLRDQTDDNLFTPESKTMVMNWVSLLSVQDEKSLLPNAGTSKAENLDLRRSAAFDLIQKCLLRDETKRISFEDVTKHPFLIKNARKFEKSALNQVVSSAVGGKKRYTFAYKLKELASLELDLEHHLFLSYVQTEGSELVRNVFYGVNSLGCSCWLDMRAKRVTEVGMLKGVLTSRAYLMVLTQNALFRPFCMKELMWAIHHKKEVLFLYETDSRFHAFDPRDFWIRWNAKELGTRERQNYINLIEDPPSLEGFRTFLNGERGGLDIEGAFEKFGKGKEAVDHLLKNDVETFLKQNLKEERMIPYRRREYENKAMLNAVLKRAGFLTVKDLNREAEAKIEVPKNYKMILIINRKQKGHGQIDLKEDILRGIMERFELEDRQIVRVEASRSGQPFNLELHHLIREVEKEVTVVFGVVSLMTPGFFKDHANSLSSLFDTVENKTKSKKKSANFGMLRRGIVAIQHKWFAQNKETRKLEASSVKESVHNLFLMHSEVMEWRPLNPRPYENRAMHQELALRLKESLERVKETMSRFDPKPKKAGRSERSKGDDSFCS